MSLTNRLKWKRNEKSSLLKPFRHELYNANHVSSDNYPSRCVVQLTRFSLNSCSPITHYELINLIGICFISIVIMSSLKPKKKAIPTHSHEVLGFSSRFADIWASEFRWISLYFYSNFFCYCSSLDCDYTLLLHLNDREWDSIDRFEFCFFNNAWCRRFPIFIVLCSIDKATATWDSFDRRCKSISKDKGKSRANIDKVDFQWR